MRLNVTLITLLSALVLTACATGNTSEEAIDIKELVQKYSVGNIKINHDGKKVQSEVSTFEIDGTCNTTMQLS